MSNPGSSQLVRPAPPLFDNARIAVAGFLARYSGGTGLVYSSDLRMRLAWCEPRLATHRSDTCGRERRSPAGAHEQAGAQQLGCGHPLSTRSRWAGRRHRQVPRCTRICAQLPVDDRERQRTTIRKGHAEGTTLDSSQEVAGLNYG
jgi:hypothetical protein